MNFESENGFIWKEGLPFEDKEEITNSVGYLAGSGEDTHEYTIHMHDLMKKLEKALDEGDMKTVASGITPQILEFFKEEEKRLDDEHKLLDVRKRSIEILRSDTAFPREKIAQEEKQISLTEKMLDDREAYILPFAQRLRFKLNAFVKKHKNK